MPCVENRLLEDNKSAYESVPSIFRGAAVYAAEFKNQGSAWVKVKVKKILITTVCMLAKCVKAKCWCAVSVHTQALNIAMVP